jgi:hypothetical protein
MSRNKKTTHRATSDVEDEEDVASDDEETTQLVPLNDTTQNDGGVDHMVEERKKYLKNAILRRTLALKRQKELNSQTTVSSTRQKY